MGYNRENSWSLILDWLSGARASAVLRAGLRTVDIREVSDTLSSSLTHQSEGICWMNGEGVKYGNDNQTRNQIWEGSFYPFLISQETLNSVGKAIQPI